MSKSQCAARSFVPRWSLDIGHWSLPNTRDLLRVRLDARQVELAVHRQLLGLDGAFGVDRQDRLIAAEVARGQILHQIDRAQPVLPPDPLLASEQPPDEIAGLGVPEVLLA